ncbi:hypothetical protein CRUP_025852 [Coryphaenoides rupestris]|nr:hypothetical protein CRUP_025852 [Coryphaenoides rupestris]
MLRPLVMCFALCAVYATSKPTEKKERVHHTEPLSSREHKDAEGFEIIVDKIDDNKDGFVTEQELNTWIKMAQKRYIYNDVDRQWKDLDENNDNKISWEEYKNITYGSYMEDDNYQTMIARAERRFKVADKNGDGIADKEEFTAFLHPEDYDHMKEIVVQETLEDIDKNGDGFIDLKEYIGDMYTHDAEMEEPDWDGKLSKEEILNKYDLFVGSHATDFGEALVRHDEF